MPILVVYGRFGTSHLSFYQREFSIGRSLSCDLVLPIQRVSRQHAKIVFENGEYYLRDLNSTNGTWINGRQIEGDHPWRLQSGDEIRVSTTRIQFIKDTAELKSRTEVTFPRGFNNGNQRNAQYLDSLAGASTSLEGEEQEEEPSAVVSQKTTAPLGNNTTAKTIFISHSSKDDEFVSHLAHRLRQLRLSTWVDHQDIGPGRDWDLEVLKGMQAATAMVVVLSPDSSKSPNVKAEWNYFLENNKPVYPLMVRQCEIPYRLKTYQVIDCIDDNEDGIIRLLVKLLND